MSDKPPKMGRIGTSPTSQGASGKQIDYIVALGGKYREGLTKDQASDMIGSLLANRPTPRQMMVLKFWNRMDLAESGVDGVSEWMDEWYGEDSRRLEAWQKWKSEYPAIGNSRSADAFQEVPLGIAYSYLESVSKSKKGGCGCAFLVLLAIGLAWLFSSERGTKTEKVRAEEEEKQRVEEHAKTDAKMAADASNAEKAARDAEAIERTMASESIEGKIQRLAKTAEKDSESSSFISCEIIKNPDGNYAVTINLRCNPDASDFPRLFQAEAIQLARACCSEVQKINAFTVVFKTKISDGIGNASDSKLVSCIVKGGIFTKVNWKERIIFKNLFETIYCLPSYRNRWNSVAPPVYK